MPTAPSSAGRGTPKGSNRDQISARVAADIAEGAVVNLGMGMPTLVANHIPRKREVILHSEKKRRARHGTAACGGRRALQPH